MLLLPIPEISLAFLDGNDVCLDALYIGSHDFHLLLKHANVRVCLPYLFECLHEQFPLGFLLIRQIFQRFCVLLKCSLSLYLLLFNRFESTFNELVFHWQSPFPVCYAFIGFLIAFPWPSTTPLGTGGISEAHGSALPSSPCADIRRMQ